MYSSYRCAFPFFFIIILRRWVETRGYDGYSDYMARRKFFPLASAAYSSSPQHCIDNNYSNASVSAL
ncbi:hypothetical protein ANCCAN_25667 [Ancylostoma caninum]|uniref:Uncharacterized protein n=1 Tax=Ancylostoma caninum TaxID=29170 RepID=A0A368FC51_ANCCA|nr:hypothetical protein ANCCAN_25667 [Ancylostoma caninum]